MEHLTIVVFGATGDLFRKKLCKVYFDLYERDILPQDTEIIGISRKAFSKEEWQHHIKTILGKDSLTEKEQQFLERMSFLQGDIHEEATFTKISEALVARDDLIGACSNKLFYLAVFPELYEELFRMLSKSGLTMPCAPKFGETEAWIKVLVEKPFGENAEKAEALDTLLGTLFSEDQIFRIDHYLAKETIQNLLVFRFANPLWSALWSHKYIKSVSIRATEEARVGERGAFYDKIGALKDVGQNHLLSLLSLIAMEMPEGLKPDQIRKERQKVLSFVKVGQHVLRGQYEGYALEPGVKENSSTETYFKASLSIDNERWKGVEFTLEHGKDMEKTEALIEICFTEKSAEELFLGGANKLIFRIQPKEVIEVEFFAKKAGFDFEIERQVMKYDYKEGGISPFIYPYEKLLSDALLSDQTLFVSTNEMKEAWRIVSDIEKKMNAKPFFTYNKKIT